MKQFPTIFTWCALAFLFSYCQPKTSTSETGAETQTSSIPDMHNAQIALDWAGMYNGTLPCADCEGIATRITLRDDLSYTLSIRYLQEEAKTFEGEGTFSWNQAGSTITLSTDGRQYFVGENMLFHLDEKGNRITGELAAHYILRKVSADNHISTGIIETYWKLVELDGQPVTATSGNQEIHFKLNQEENSIRGFAGCNGFGGSFEIAGENQITFSQLFSTKMACPDLDIENKFMRAMEATRTFKIGQDTLWLIDSDKTLVAKFEASHQ